MLKTSNIYLTPFAMKRKHIVYKHQSRMRKFSFGGLGVGTDIVKWIIF